MENTSDVGRDEDKKTNIDIETKQQEQEQKDVVEAKTGDDHCYDGKAEEEMSVYRSHNDNSDADGDTGSRVVVESFNTSDVDVPVISDSSMYYTLNCNNMQNLLDTCKTNTVNIGKVTEGTTEFSILEEIKSSSSVSFVLTLPKMSIIAGVAEMAGLSEEKGKGISIPIIWKRLVLVPYDKVPQLAETPELKKALETEIIFNKIESSQMQDLADLVWTHDEEQVSEYADRLIKSISKKDNKEHSKENDRSTKRATEHKETRRSKISFDVRHMNYEQYCQKHYAFEIDKYKQSMSGNGPPYTAGNFPAPVQGAMQPPFSNVYPAPGAQSNYPAY